MRIVNRDDVLRILDMKTCIDLMAEAMRAFSAGSTKAPSRLISPLFNGRDLLALMPGAAAPLGCFGAKVVSFFPANPGNGRESVHGFVAIFDEDTGKPKAIVEGGAITAVRTAAASALATRVLARQDARTCGIFGAGAQAESHLRAIRVVRSIETVRVWARDGERARTFARRMSMAEGVTVEAVGDPREAAQSDIVCAVTSASEPVLKGEWVPPGAHVNLVGAHSAGAREADTALMARAAIFVDSLEGMRREAGDILIPIKEGAFALDHVRGEIGAVLSGAIEGRTSPDQVTIYKSLGAVVQDLYAAHYVAAKADEDDRALLASGW